VDHVRPHTRVVAAGRGRVLPVLELRRSVDDVTEYAVCGAGLSDR
jgi:hypothetical protein